MIDRIWGIDPPDKARTVLYSYVTRLRRILADAQSPGSPPARMLRRPTGYLLDIPPQWVDVHRVHRALARVNAVDRSDEGRIDLLRRAVRLWQDEPLAGLPGAWAAGVRQQLQQLMLGNLTEWADAELAVGQAAPVVARLAHAVAQHPLAEAASARLIRALYLNGQRAEALEQFTRCRRHMIEELGVEPGRELQELHRTILRGEPVVAGGAGSAGASHREELPPNARPGRKHHEQPGVATVVKPGCQLPADLPDYVGAETIIKRVLAQQQESAGRRPSVIILSGPSGVGKTALSVRLGHLLRGHYPDGQIFVQMGDWSDNPMEALGRALRALGVADVGQLTTVQDRLSQYRAVLSQQRILLVLDAAPNAQPVRWLAPGSPGSALIVSSRARLATVPGAHRVEVPMLTHEQSRLLLSRIAGVDRLAMDPLAVDALVTACAGLPLAVRIVGARLASYPHRPIRQLAERMRDERQRLDELQTEGLAVRAGMTAAYRALPDDAQSAFRLLGATTPPNAGPWHPLGVEQYASIPHSLLEQLVEIRLLDVAEQPASDAARFRIHELVRLYAHECARPGETGGYDREGGLGMHDGTTAFAA
ncbi:DNA-binding SARP family transcriptional activator/DNA polymerase III delta prime subunit [Micromonospora ureilytica]|uniref:DNA-binding SARP family transcriptional activator/DNA polymerase III delta prime subunit n=2 Tax=Micromonospora ureilytica TaxID=709868 RepID=A0ABS0JAQ7_9ACTN|nr:DNA-binding SARP family transcriptional activator/DNA polymerase III delta prime subunit [Micromonospora ureilytica]